jgi:hypothetical protein
MKYYYFDVETMSGVQRHILQPLTGGVVRSFPLTEDNPNKVAYDAWVAEGNTAEEWSAE